MAEFKADFTGAIRKTQALKSVPRAMKYQVTRWTVDTVKELKRRAAGMQKSGKGRKTGQLARNIGQTISAGNERYHATIGTGVGGTKSVVYARIQDKGGTIVPRSKQYLTIPLGGVKGRADNYPNSFFIRSKAGNLLLVERKGKGGIRPLFVLKKQVTIPGSGWFTDTVTMREGVLIDMVTPDAVLAQAERMAQGGGR